MLHKAQGRFLRRAPPRKGPRDVPFVGPPMVPGYTKPLILLPSESVWVSLSRTMEKTTIEKEAEGTRKRGRKEDEREEHAEEEGRQRRGWEEAREITATTVVAMVYLGKSSSTRFSRRLLDYAGIRNFRGSSDTARNHPRNWCCPATQSRPVQTARFFSPTCAPALSLSPAFCLSFFKHIRENGGNIFIILVVTRERSTHVSRHELSHFRT